MVRAYVAHTDHTLWRNSAYNHEVMSLGIHEHRTDITMVPLFGSVYNTVITEDLTRRVASRLLKEFRFSSYIKSGKGGFEPTGFLERFDLVDIKLNYATWMKGSAKHSVYVPQGEEAAWMIIEGEPNHEYGPALLTNHFGLDAAEFSELYQPMTQERLDLNMDILSKYCGNVR